MVKHIGHWRVRAVAVVPAIGAVAPQAVNFPFLMEPEDFRPKDTTKLYSAAADIVAIPGMLGANCSLDENAQNTTEMAATLIATAVGHGRRATIHDSMWQGAHRNALK
jgi:hypothetical protein